MYRFPVKPPRSQRTWVCPTCETGGKGTRPLICWCCGQPAVDIGPAHIDVNASLITRASRRRRGAVASPPR